MESYFKVWSTWKVYEEEPPQSRVAGMFYYLSDAIDFAQKLQEDGVRCVLNGLAGGRHSVYDVVGSKVL